MPEALKAKIRRTVRGFIELLFDVDHSTHPAADANDGDSLITRANQETDVQLGLDWKQESEIVPVLEMMSQAISRGTSGGCLTNPTTTKRIVASLQTASL